MRVLFWSGTFWPNIGGVEVLAAKLLPALRERGYEYLVVVPRNDPKLSEEADYKGIPICRVSFRNDLTDKSIEHFVAVREKISALKRSFAPDLIHINAVGVDNFFHLSTKNTYPAPLLVTLHGEWQLQADAVVRDLLRAADWVAGCSAAILTEGQKLAPEIAPRSSIIYNGMDAPSVLPTPLSFDTPRLLCLGRLVPEKGMDLALAAFATLVPRFPRARLIVAGDGAARSGLEHQAADLHISHAVEFAGWVAPDQVPALINNCTMLLTPSRDDSLPLVALEAAWMARPVVAARVGGLPEVVVHEQTGLLFESENVGGLAESISFLLENPEAARKMGRAARDRVQTVFSWEQHVNTYDALYQKLINRQGPPVMRSA
jgi:glycogen synthase